MHLLEQGIDHSMAIWKKPRPYGLVTYGGHASLMEISGWHRPHIRISFRASLDQAHLDPRRSVTTWMILQACLPEAQEVCKQASNITCLWFFMPTLV